MARSAGLVSGLTLISRLMGLVRELVFAALLGAGLHADAFQVAYRIPNMLRGMLAEGSLSAALIPVLSRTLAREGKARAHQVASRVLTLLACAVCLVIVAILLWTEPLVRALAPGFEAIGGKVETAVVLTRVMTPYLAFVSFAAVAMGMLNARERFGIPALAPIAFNVVTVAWGAGLWLAGFGLAQVAVGWAIGTVLGGLGQWLIQLWGLRGEGWRFQPQWAPRDRAVRQIGSLMAPATLGLAAIQINIFVSNIFASQDPGAVSWIAYAFRVLFLPIGVFGVAIGTIAGVGLARKAASDDMAGLQATLRRGLRMLVFVSVPATVGLVLLRLPIVRLLYERGRFGPADTLGTADALLYYSLGLVAYNGVKVLSPAFYALGSGRVPVAGSIISVAVNVILILLLHSRMGFVAVALGTSVGSLAGLAFQTYVFERRVGGLWGHGLGRAFASMAVAAAVMAPAVWWCAAGLEAQLGLGLLGKLATGLVPVAVGALVYFAAARLLGLEEARGLFGLLSRVRR